MAKKVLAINVNGDMTYCSCPPEERGKGRCNHIDHQRENESVDAFVKRINENKKKEKENSSKNNIDEPHEITQDEINEIANKIDQIAGEKVTVDNWKEVLQRLTPDQVAQISNLSFEAAPKFSLPISSENYEDQDIQNKLYFTNLPEYGIGGSIDAVKQMFEKIGPTISDDGVKDIENSYKTGLTPEEYFLRQFSARDASISKSVRTAKPGHCIYENSIVEILNENNEIETCLWSEVEVGTIFVNNSVCTELSEWKKKPCYEIKVENHPPIIVSEDHLISGSLIIGNECVCDLEFSKQAREYVGETDLSWISAKDIYILTSYFGAVFHSDTAETIEYIKSYNNGKPVRTRCISSSLGFYETNGLFHHNTARKLFYCMSDTQVFDDCGGPYIDVLHCKAPEGHICQKCANITHGGERVKSGDLIGGVISTNISEAIYQLSMKQKHMGTLETSQQQRESGEIMATLDGWGTSEIVEKAAEAETTEEARQIYYEGLKELYKKAGIEQDDFNIQAVARKMTSYKRTPDGLRPVEPEEKCDIVSTTAVGNANNIFKTAELGSGYKYLVKPREEKLNPDPANRILG